MNPDGDPPLAPRPADEPTRTDSEVFARWFELYHDRILAQCVRMLRDRAAAEDIAQETLLRAWLGRERMREEDLGAWLSVVARNLCVSHIRRHKKQVPTEVLPDTPDENADPARHAERNESRRAVRHAMKQVGDRHRRLLFRHAIDEVEYEKLSEELGLTPSGTRAVLFRARRAMRDHLAAAGEGMAAFVAGVRVRIHSAARRTRTVWNEPLGNIGAQAGLNLALALGIALSGNPGLPAPASAAAAAAALGRPRSAIAGPPPVAGRSGLQQAAGESRGASARGDDSPAAALGVRGHVYYTHKLDETGFKGEVDPPGPIHSLYIETTGDRHEDPDDPRTTYWLMDLADAQLCKRAVDVCALLESH